MAHIDKPWQRRDGTWSTRVTYYVRGERRRTPVGPYPSEKELLRAAEHTQNAIERAKFLHELEYEGDAAAIGETMVAVELVGEWERLHVDVELKGQGPSEYKRLAKSRFLPFWESRGPIGTLTRTDGLEWRRWLVETVRSDLRQRGELDETDPYQGIASVNRTLTMGRSIFSFARKNDWIRRSPLESVNDLDYVPNEERWDLPIPPELVEQLRIEMLAEPEGEEWERLRNVLTIELIGYVCLRQQDAFGAYWRQILKDEETVRTRFLVPRQRRGASGRKSRSSEREPFIPEPVRETALELYRVLERPGLDAVLLPNKSGGHLMR